MLMFQEEMFGVQRQCMMCMCQYVEVRHDLSNLRVAKKGRIMVIHGLCSKECFHHVRPEKQENYLRPTDDYDQWG
jgi:hypothetical protein